MPILILCPHCETRLSAPKKKAGKEVRCPNCTQRILLPPPRDEALPAIVIEVGPSPEALPPPKPNPIEERDDRDDRDTKKSQSFSDEDDPTTEEFNFQEPERQGPYDEPEPRMRYYREGEDLEYREPKYRRPNYRNHYLRRDYEPEYTSALSLPYRPNRSTLVDFVGLFNFLTGLSYFGFVVLTIFGKKLYEERHGRPESNGLFYTGISLLVFNLILVCGFFHMVTAFGIWMRRYWGCILGIIFAAIDGMWAFAFIIWKEPCLLFFTGPSCIFCLVILLSPRYSQDFK